MSPVGRSSGVGHGCLGSRLGHGGWAHAGAPRLKRATNRRRDPPAPDPASRGRRDPATADADRALPASTNRWQQGEGEEREDGPAAALGRAPRPLAGATREGRGGRIPLNAGMIESITTRKKPSSSAGFWPISCAGKGATDKALQLKLSSSTGWHALLIYLLSNSAFHANHYC